MESKIGNVILFGTMMRSDGPADSPKICSFLSLSFALVLLITTPNSFASTWKGDALLARIAKAPWQFGIFRIQPQIILSDFGYDSNLYQTPNAIADYSLTAGPAFTGFLSLKKKLIVTVSESPRYTYFFKTTKERTWNNYLQGDVSLLLNKFFITVGAGLTDARQRWNYEIDIRPRLKQQDFSASALWQPSLKISLSLSYRFTRANYENIQYLQYNLAERLNHDETYLNGTLYYRLTARTQAFIDFELGRFNFPNPLDPRDSKSRAVYSGFEFSATGRIRGRLRLGYKDYAPLATTQPGFKGLVGDSSLTVYVLRTLAIRASYAREIRFSLYENYSYYLDNSLGAGLSFYLFNRHVRLDYNYNWIFYDYKAAPLSTLVASASRQDNIWMNSIGLYYRIGKTVGVGIRAGRYTQKIIGYAWAANRDFLALNLTYDF